MTYNSATATATGTSDIKVTSRVGPPFKAAVKSGRCFDES